MNAHVERPTRLADGKTYCACGRPWPCPHAAPADPSAILAEIRDRNIDAWAEGGTSDIPVLLAAVEAALKAADEARPHILGISGGYWTLWDLDPSKLRAAITAALTGTGEEGGSDEPGH